MVPSRALFGVERVWLAADRLGSPFVNQLVVELDGEVERPALEAAIGVVLPLWPAARARVSGWLGASRWTADGAPPHVVGPCAIGVDGGPAPFETARLNPQEGPIVEWVFGPHPRGGCALVLRTHHAAFDGRAAWALAEDLGAALRGEPVRGARFAGMEEPGGGFVQPEPAADAAFPTGASSAAAGSRWVRTTLPRPGRQVLPRALVALARVAATVGGVAPIRLSVPVDLRAHLSEADRRVAANLTGFVRLDVRPDATPSALQAALRAAVIGPEPLGSLRTGDTVRNVPLWLMAMVGRRGAATAAALGRTTTSGTVSNLGRLDMGVFDHAGCRGRGCFWIPPTTPGTPVFVTLTGHANGLEVLVGMPNEFGDGGRLERFAVEFVAAMA